MNRELSQESTRNVLNENEEVFYREAFQRNIGLLSDGEQRHLRNTRVAIAGMGGVGGIHATTLARLGVGKFHFADFDVFNVVNINRQAGATRSSMGHKKTDVMKELVLDINPFAQVIVFPYGVTNETRDAFLEGVDIVIDGLDFFEIEARRALYQRAREKNIFVVSAGPVGFGSAIFTVDPKGMSFDKYFDIHDGMSREEMVLRFGIGLTPALLQRAYFQPASIDLKEKKAPSLVSGTLLASSIVASETIKILFKKPLRVIPCSAQFDPFVERYKKVWLPFGNRGVIQRLKIWIVWKQLHKKNAIS
jgi:molybdopterin/thiamine biosynthesis adenylyltransferase